MGHLLSSAIKMQSSSAAATATVQYSFSTNSFSGTMWVYVNNSLYQMMTVDTPTVTITLNAGDTLFLGIQQPTGNGCSIDYLLNGSYVTSYFTLGTGFLYTPMYTIAGGNTYVFYGNLGIV